MEQTALKTTQLGITGLEITRVGFGAWAIGGAGWAHAWGGQDDEESVTAIQHAVGSGINWIDTAAVYGLGHSEEVVARALRDIPPSERPYVFTKGGMVWDAANPAAEPARIGRPASLRREVEASLRRLGVERIDLYQMHWPLDDGTPLEVDWSTTQELKRAGKVRAVGRRRSVDRRRREALHRRASTLCRPSEWMAAGWVPALGRHLRGLTPRWLVRPTCAA
jgi:aryl-alcohol dehydrogenase-like predicted oxidoreductase